MNWTNVFTFIIAWMSLLSLALVVWQAAWRWNAVDRVFAVPMWLFTRLVTHLSKNHPWHGRRFALEDWRRGRTILTRQCDLIAWSILICVPIILYRLVHL